MFTIYGLSNLKAQEPITNRLLTGNNPQVTALMHEIMSDEHILPPSLVCKLNVFAFALFARGYSFQL